jgi:hypothetical protein
LTKQSGVQHGFAAIGAEEYVLNSLSLLSNWMKVKQQFFKCTY